MKDRFSDTSKQIFDNPDFEEVQNAIGQLEQIIRVAQSRHRAGGHDDPNRVFPSTSAAAIAALAAAAGKSKEGSPTTTGGGPSGVSNINNNNIIIPTKTTKSNGIESIIAIPNANSGDCDAAAVNKNDKKTNKPVIIRNGGNHIKSSAVAAPTPYHKHNSSAVTTTTVILHNTDNNRNVVDDDGHVARPSASAATSVKAKVNGIKNSSSATTTQHASQPKGTATVSTETTRSGSKTPEITITPGSEVLGGDLVDTELPESRLLSSAESGVVERERVSPEDLPDSGCTGLLDEDEDSCSLQRAGSSSTAGDQIVGASSSAAAVGSGVSASDRGGGDRDSGGGSVASSSGTGAGAYQRSTAEIKEAIYAQLQKRRSGSSEQPLFPHHHPQQPLLHVEGPVDGSPYAIINPLVKQKTLADSGISVDQMKDLDRLLNALVLEADSIDIPYHARTDSLPFSYTAPSGPPPSSAPAQVTGSKRSPYGGLGSSTSSRYAVGSSSSASYQQQQQQQSPYGTSAPIAASGGGSRYRGLEHSISTPGTRLSSSVSSQSYQPQQQQVPQYYQSAIEEQIVNPEPISSYSRSVSRQPSSSGSNTGRIGARTSEQQQPQGYRVRPSLSSTSFSNYGNGNGTGITRRMRSQSADGRRESERDEDADEWLARQMKRLQEKRASRNAPRSDWLAELKAALPAATAGGSTAGATPSAIANISSYGTAATSTSITTLDRTYDQSRASASAAASINEYRPYSASTREDLTTSSVAAVLGVGGATTGTSVMGGGGRRSHVSYSSEDDDDVELEMFQRGRRVQRHYSESAYDRGMTSGGSTRAPSQLSNVVETPFPTCPPTPYFNRPVSPGKPPRSPKGIRRQISAPTVPILQEIPGRMERAQTPVNPRPVYMGDSEVKFAQDLSEHWYKPFASREETVSALVNQTAGAFLIRNSNSFPGAFGLAVKVSSTAGEKGIRHFLIEPTRFGVRLRGSPLEPVFSSLSALVYAHSIDPLALPTTLALPNFDILPKSSQSTTALLLRQGAACQLLFLGITSVECLTGDEAIHKGVQQISGKAPIPISLRLSKHGLTLTDVFRKQFFRLHFALNDISYASLVPGRSVAYGNDVKQVFSIVARAPRATENSVIVLAELEQGQPANAIVSFILRVVAWQH